MKSRTYLLRRFSRRSALTLIEVMIAMALTLIMMAALTQAFQMIGDSVTFRRATIDMNTQLRTAVLKLENDLEGLTAIALPGQDEGSGTGYLEIVDFGVRDRNWAGSPGQFTNMLGDFDDYLAFTVRTTGAPFTGQFAGATIQSRVAEIIWWCRFRDSVGSGEPYFDANNNGGFDAGERYIDINNNNACDSPRPFQNEDFTLHRRVLLVRPDLYSESGDVNSNGTLNSGEWIDFNSNWKLDPGEWIDSNSNGVADPGEFPDWNGNGILDEGHPNWYQQVRFGITPQFLQDNDVSVSVHPANGATTAPPWFYFPNSLADLAKRSNRFAHTVAYATNDTHPGLALAYPHKVDVGYDNLLKRGYALTYPREGEDVMLSHVLGFDVRVFDPAAERRRSPSGSVVTPGDPGFAGEPYGDVNSNGRYDPGEPFTDLNTNGVWDNGGTTTLGSGAYVDLAYSPTSLPVYGSSYFSSLPHPKSGFNGEPFVDTNGNYFRDSGESYADLNGNGSYDFWLIPTWENWWQGYERDGVNQDLDGMTDEGTDGFDSDGVNGVDDGGERETMPPYSSALRGLQIRIRIVNHDTRQIRQQTVTVKLLPE